MQLLDDKFFMQIALMEAEKALEIGEVPVGVVIVCNQQIVAKAHNLTQTLNDVTAHAEMQAITSAANSLGSKYLKDCTMYVTLEPCQMCAGASYWAQIGRIVFAADDEKRGYRALGTMIHPKTIVTTGVFTDKASDILLEFFQQKRLK